MYLKEIWEVARMEFWTVSKSKIVLIFGITFATLALGISYLGLVTAGFTTFNGFTRTSISLLNLVVYLVPLLTLVVGSLNIIGEQGSWELLNSQPLTRAQVLFGKFLGIYSSLMGAVFLGFGLAGAIIALQAGTGDWLRYLVLVGMSLLLVLTFLAISVLVAILFRDKTRTLGTALILWFILVVVYDLLVVGIMVGFKGFFMEEGLLLLLLFNPLDIFRIFSLITLGGAMSLGPAGAILLDYLNEPFAQIILMVALFIWITLPMTLAARLFQRQDI